MGTDICTFLNWLAYHGWIGPLMGVSVFGVAVVIGRRLLAKRPAAAADGEEWGAQYLTGVTRERRAAPRRRGNMVEVRLDDCSGAEPVAGWITDRSVGGLGLLANAPIQIGTALRVRAKEAPETTSWVDVTVRSCQRNGPQYELGCQFHRTPDWNLLLQFG